MDTLLVLLLFIFGGVGLMVLLGERFAKPADPERLARLQRWIIPLVGLSIVISLVNYYIN